MTNNTCQEFSRQTRQGHISDIIIHHSKIILQSSCIKLVLIDFVIYLDRKEKLKVTTDNFYQRDVAIIKLKNPFKDTVPICVKKHTKIEADMLKNKKTLYMSGQFEQLPVF